MVDTGGQNRRNELVQALQHRNVTQLNYLLLTHTHFDHAGNARMVRDAYQARVVAHAAERTILENGVSAIPKGTNIFTKAGVALGGTTFGRLSKFAPCPVDIATEDRYALPDWPGITTLHTPGHTAGSQCIIVDDEYALAGDTIFALFPGVIYPPFANLPELLPQSWERLLQTGCHTFLPGHGRPRTRDMLAKRLASIR